MTSAATASRTPKRRRLRGGKSSSGGLLVTVFIVYGFLYLPVAVIVLFAFASNTTQSLPIEGFTLHWFREAIGTSLLIEAARNSLLVALAAVAISTIVGVPMALLLDRFDFPGKELLRRFVLLPLVLPGVVTGVAFQSFYSALNFPRSLALVALAHGTALTSTVVTTVYARLLRSDPSLEEASMDLGMNRLQTFRHVTWPSITPAVLAAALLTFTLSFDEIPVTIFLTGEGGNTLPMVMWSTLRRASPPEYVAFAVIVLLVGLITVTLSARLSTAGTNENTAR